MRDTARRMHHVEVEVCTESDLVSIKQPMDFEEEQTISLSIEQCATVARWLKEISEGA